MCERVLILEVVELKELPERTVVEVWFGNRQRKA